MDSPPNVHHHRAVSSTSIEAYHDATRQALAAGQRDKLLKLYKEIDARVTDREASEALMLPCSTISARRNELISLGLVEEAGKIKDLTTGMTVKAFKHIKHIVTYGGI